MALAIHSLPTAYKGNGTSGGATTSSFTAPANSQIWVFVGWDTSDDSSDFTYSSSPALTWTEISTPLTVGGACAGIAYANVGGSDFTGTVSLSVTLGASFPGHSIYLAVLTGAEETPGGEIIRLGFGGVGLPYFSNASIGGADLTATATGSLFFGVSTDWAGNAYNSGQLRLGTDQTHINDHTVGSDYASAFFRSTDPLTQGNDYDGGYDGSTKTNFQIHAVEIRPGAEASNPTVTAELWEDGSLVASLGEVEVSADGVIEFNWDAADLADITGADVELRLTSDESVDYDAIEWEMWRVPGGEAPAVVESWGMVLM